MAMFYPVKTVIRDDMTKTVTIEPPIEWNKLYYPEPELIEDEHEQTYIDYFEFRSQALEWKKKMEHENRAFLG